MKHLIKPSLCLFMALLFQVNVFAQNHPAEKKPSHHEKVLVQNAATTEGYFSVQEAYNGALREAKKKYPNKAVDIRNLKMGESVFDSKGNSSPQYTYTIVELPDAITLALSSALRGALADVRIDKEGKFAIDKVVSDEYRNNVDKEKIRSEVIFILKENGHKLVAREALPALYKDIKGQHGTDVYNPETIVKDKNFSATGYYIDITITDDYLQVYIINVSTGEYDGNAIVYF